MYSGSQGRAFPPLPRVTKIKTLIQELITSETSQDQGASSLVDRDSSPDKRSPADQVLPCPHSVHRCLFRGMGSSPQRSGSFRDLEVRGKDTPQQHLGDEGGQAASSGKVRIHSPEPGHPDSNGQHHRSLLPQSPRRNQILVVDGGHKRGVPDHTETTGRPESPPHTRKAERPGRPSEQEGTSAANRVVAASSGIRGTVATVGETNYRPVCHTSQQQTIIVCKSGSRQLSFRRRCTDDILESPLRLCIPSNGSCPTSPAQAQRVNLRDGPNSPLLAGESLVSRSSGTTSVPSCSTTTEDRPTETAAPPSLSSERANVKSTRMEAIQQAVEKKGFSLKVSQMVSSTVCAGSEKVYQSRWAAFSEWCERNKMSPTTASLQQVADFLLYLFEDRQSSLSTIKGYRTAIAKVLSHTTGVDISHDGVLSDLISAFEHQRPQRIASFPKWDLKIVLDSLTRSPYEPLHTADRKALTLKTCFLLFLASGSRCGEIHALDIRHIVQREHWKFVSLAPHPNFLPKNFNYSTGGRNFEGFQIESLKHRLGPGLEEEALLCPVRALRFYLDKTKPLRGDNSQLFISMVGDKRKPICKNTIASWVKNTVLEAYKNTPGEAAENLKISSHEVRALATSTAFYHNVAMEEVMKAARWANQSTFTTFYLRDVAEDMEGIKRLAPLNIAQSVLR